MKGGRGEKDIGEEKGPHPPYKNVGSATVLRVRSASGYKGIRMKVEKKLRTGSK